MQNWIVAFERLHERADPTGWRWSGLLGFKQATLGNVSGEQVVLARDFLDAL
jgi:hypothetical protein